MQITSNYSQNERNIGQKSWGPRDLRIFLRSSVKDGRCRRQLASGDDPSDILEELDLMVSLSHGSMDWFVGENLQETIDIPIKYGAFL